MQALYRPTHAYVPGQTARHAEGFLDAIRATVRGGMTPDDLAESAAFRHGLFYLETGFFWEAHEALEPVWMALPDESAERRFVQALIQTANALLKDRMNRPRAVRRICMIARDLLPAARDVTIMGVKAGAIHAILDSLEVEKRCEI